MNMLSMIFPFLLLLVYIPIIALSIYIGILFIKLARRGIRALDIYLDEKGRGL